jgi:hypothetical protein
MTASTPQRSINVKPVHQDHAPTSDAHDPLPSQPRPTRIVRGEAQLVAQLSDGAPALQRAAAAVERARLLLKFRVRRLERLMRAHAEIRS